MILIAIAFIGIVVFVGNVETKNVDVYKQHNEIFYDDYFDM